MMPILRGMEEGMNRGILGQLHGLLLVEAIIWPV
jgi:hypothetical protein